MKKYFAFHPFLFSLFHILFLFSHNVEQVSNFEFLLPSSIALSLTLMLVLLSRSIVKDYNKADIIISVAIVLFFSYGHIYDLILDQHIGSFEIGRHRYLFITWGLLFTSSAYLTIRTHRDLHNLTNTLNITALSLVFISLFNIGVYELKLKNIRQDISTRMERQEITITDSEKVSEFRDIYYIILDGYASSSTLKDIYDYDNEKFTEYLEAKGFYVATKSQTNYPLSFLSIASSLNMKYVNYLTDVKRVKSKDPKIPYQMITDNKVMSFLKLKGYKFIHFSSGWGPTDRNMHADLNIRSKTFNEFLILLIQTTMLRPIERPIISDLSKSRLYTFSKLAKIPNINGPKFVFAHIVAPHPPYLFGENGESVPDTKLTMGGGTWSQKEDYLKQLTFVNKEVEKIVSEILIKSKVPPIIILQADHGPASTFSEDMFWQGKGWSATPTENMLRERMGILNAYYLPSGGNDLLYESITPVNTFRLVFDFYFNTNCGLLVDQSYYSAYDRPYEFIDVTDKIKHH